jgi:hypothetical protein
MKLFSWFIKTDKRSKSKDDILETSTSTELESALDNELNTINSNTMWPIAKVKTTTMIIKRPVKKDTNSKNKIVNLGLVTIPLAHE